MREYRRNVCTLFACFGDFAFAETSLFWLAAKENVAKRLKFFRKLKGISAKQMSIDIGENESYISKIENRRIPPSIEGFADIVKYIGITRDFFFEVQM